MVTSIPHGAPHRAKASRLKAGASTKHLESEAPHSAQNFPWNISVRHFGQITDMGFLSCLVIGENTQKFAYRNSRFKNMLRAIPFHQRWRAKTGMRHRS